MGKYTMIDNSDAISYWPYYVASIVISSLFSMVCIFVLIVTIWLALDNKLSNNLGIIIFLCVLSVSWFVFIKQVRKVAYTQIYIDRTEIYVSNKVTNNNQQIKWENVCEVQHCKNKWYGTEFYRVCDVVLPAHSVNAERIADFFPVHVTVVER